MHSDFDRNMTGTRGLGHVLLATGRVANAFSLNDTGTKFDEVFAAIPDKLYCSFACVFICWRRISWNSACYMRAVLTLCLQAGAVFCKKSKKN